MAGDLDREFSEACRRAMRAQPVSGAPDYPCPCGARAGEFCRVCREVLVRPVAGVEECACDVCTSVG
jgi:hypothetical protein